MDRQAGEKYGQESVPTHVEWNRPPTQQPIWRTGKAEPKLRLPFRHQLQPGISKEPTKLPQFANSLGVFGRAY